LRDRSINKQYVIIDEAQNLSQSQIKVIITRIGENTKLIMLSSECIRSKLVEDAINRLG